MNWFPRILIVLSVVILVAVLRADAQEALGIQAEPTPIPDRTSQPEAPAESASATDSTPTPKKKSKGPATSVEEMSPDEFKRMGLDKLSPDELKTLNEWLRGYRHAAETKAAAQASEQTRAEVKEEARAEAKKEFNRNWLSTDRIYSRIDGQFYGLKKYTKKAIIHLEDGSTWKQANEDDNLEAKLTDHPPVMVTHSTVGSKMHVIGAGEFWVNPVRSR